MSRTRIELGIGSLCALVALGCAGTARGPAAPQIIAGSVCSGLAPLSAASLGGGTAPARATGLAALITGEPTSELALVELSTHRVRWRKSLQASARPEVLHDVVVVGAADQTLVAYDLASGAERFRKPLPQPLWLGAAQSGKTVVVTSTAASWDPRLRGSSLIAFDAESGSVRWRREVPFALSRPALHGDRVLVVSDRADLLALDLESGEPAGCGPLGGNNAEWLESAGEHVYFGAAEARLLGSDAREAGSALELPRANLPGRPFFRASSYQPLPAARSAHGRVAVIAPLSTQGARLAPAPFYFVFYRDVFGFRADGTLAWAQLLDADVARAEASSAGLWLIDEAGALRLFDAASGGVRARAALGLRVASADLQPPAAAADSGEALQPAAADALQAGLKRVAVDTDARLLPARSLAVDELARLDTDSATGDLLAIYSAPNTPSLLRERIAKRLSERTRGAEHLLAALAEHADFLEQRPAPPLRAIVPSLVRQHEMRALPGLIDQLFDPETAREDLPMLVSAIDALSGQEGTEPLGRFFAMYRADSSLADDPRALALAAEAILARDDVGSRALLAATRDSELAPAALREQLASLLRPPPEPSAAPAEVASAPAPAPPPPELREVLDAARPAFDPCLTEAKAKAPKLNAVRVSFVAQPDGAVKDVHVTPIDPKLASCLSAELRKLQLPAQRGKQLVTYRLVLPPTAARPVAVAASAPSEFWTAAEQAAAKQSKRVTAPAWWQDQNPLFVAIDNQPPAPPVQGPVKPQPQQVKPAPQEEKPNGEPAAADDAWWVPASN